MLNRFGKEKTEDILTENNRTPALCLRVNRLKTTAENLLALLEDAGISAQNGSLCDTALLIESGGVQQLPAYGNGLFTLQDQSAQLAALALSPEAGDTVFDVCAAPGGKTTHLAELMDNKGKILALDLYEKRLLSVDAAAKRLGISIIQTIEADAAKFSFPQKADKILVDAPCSGLGVIRRRPDIKYKENVTDFVEIVRIQRDILNHCANFLKPGGVLVYSTCTINPAENEEQISEFLKTHPDFSLVPATHPQITGAKELLQKGMESFYPTKDGGDGFFIAKLKRRNDDETI